MALTKADTERIEIANKLLREHLAPTLQLKQAARKYGLRSQKIASAYRQKLLDKVSASRESISRKSGIDRPTTTVLTKIFSLPSTLFSKRARAGLPDRMHELFGIS